MNEFCSTTTIPAGTPKLWRIIGVFDGKLRIIRNESIGAFSYDTSSTNINGGNGINEWSQSDLMKLLNPGYETNTDFDSNGEIKITVNNSLYWNSGNGKCYNNERYANADCNFTNSGLSNKAKNNIIDQKVYLGTDYVDFHNNTIYVGERSNNTIVSSDGITRTKEWIGKVALPYFSDLAYAVDSNNCQELSLYSNNCSVDKNNNWMINSNFWMINPVYSSTNGSVGIMASSQMIASNAVADAFGIYPTLVLDPSLLFDDTTDGSIEHPYKIID